MDPKSRTSGTVKTLIGCILFTLVLGMSGDIGSRLTVRRVEALLSKSTPVGSTKDDVIGFLESENIEHSDYFQTFESGFQEVDGSVVRVEVQRRLIRAAIRDVQRKAEIKWDIFIKFYFGEDDRLTHYSVQKLGTGF